MGSEIHIISVYFAFLGYLAHVAQSAEHILGKDEAASSILAVGLKNEQLKEEQQWQRPSLTEVSRT